MKKLFFIFLLLSFPNICQAAITYVDSGLNRDGSVSSLAVNAASQVTGNQGALCIAIDYAGPNVTVSSVTDASGSTWTFRAGVTNAGEVRIELWTTSNFLGNATNVTTNLSGTADSITTSVAAFSGVANIGNTNTATGNSTTPSVSVTTQDANNFVVGCHGYRDSTGVTWSANTGTIRQEYGATGPSAAGLALITNTSVSPASTTTSATLGSSKQWGSAIAELRSASADVRRRRTVILP